MRFNFQENPVIWLEQANKVTHPRAVLKLFMQFSYSLLHAISPKSAKTEDVTSDVRSSKYGSNSSNQPIESSQVFKKLTAFLIF
jgi:hypothetical protein